MFYEVDRDPYLPKHSHSSFMSSPESSPAESSSLESLDASPPMFSFGQGVERTRDEPEWKSGGVARRTHTTPAKKDTRLIPSSQGRKSTEDDKIERYRETKAQQYEAYKKNVELKKQMKAIDEEHEYRMRTGRSLAPTTSEKKKKKPSYLYRKVEQYIGNPNEVADLMLFLGLGGFAWGVVHPDSFKKFIGTALPFLAKHALSKINPDLAKEFAKEDTVAPMDADLWNGEADALLEPIHLQLQLFLRQERADVNRRKPDVIEYLKTLTTSGKFKSITLLLRKGEKIQEINSNENYKKLKDIKDLVEYTYGIIPQGITNYVQLFELLQNKQKSIDLTLKEKEDAIQAQIQAQAQLPQSTGFCDFVNRNTVLTLIPIYRNLQKQTVTNSITVLQVNIESYINRIQQQKSEATNSNILCLLIMLCIEYEQMAENHSTVEYLKTNALSCLKELIRQNNNASCPNELLISLMCCAANFKLLQDVIIEHLTATIDKSIPDTEKEKYNFNVIVRDKSTCDIIPPFTFARDQINLCKTANELKAIDDVFTHTPNVDHFVDKAYNCVCLKNASIYDLILKLMLMPDDYQTLLKAVCLKQIYINVVEL